jgi:hypothetical protein
VSRPHSLALVALAAAACGAPLAAAPSSIVPPSYPDLPPERAQARAPEPRDDADGADELAAAARRARSLALVGGVYASVGLIEYVARLGHAPAHPFLISDQDGYFGANTYAGGEDKLGHAWMTMTLTRLASRALRAGGWSDTGAAIVGGGLAYGLMLAHEIEDGYQYEFSPGDLMGNTAGLLLGIATELSPGLDRVIDFRVEYWPSPEYLAILANQRPHTAGDLLPFQDYSGETYLLAIHNHWSSWTELVDFVVGFHAQNYKPNPIPPGKTQSQDLFVGVSLDVQQLFDHMRPGKVRTIGHAVTEVLSVPATVPIASFER